ncbi:MAG: hypothetical protein AB7U82_28730 [Blastocatellales bacterium]
MSTEKEIAALVRRDHPGEYDDWGDLEIYESLVEDKPDLYYHYMEKARGLMQSAAHAADRISPTGFKWVAEWQTRQSKARTDLASQVSQEIAAARNVAGQLESIAQAEWTRKFQDVQQVTALMREAVTRAEVVSRGNLITAAGEMGVDVPTYLLFKNQVLANQAEVDKVLALQYAEVEKEKALNKERERHERELLKIEKERIDQEAEAEIRDGLRTTVLLPHERIRQIQTEIDTLNDRIDKIEGNEKKKAEYDRLVRRVEAYYSEIRLVEEGLIPDSSGAKKRATIKKHRTPRDIR